jgi:hypothetical protein
VRTLSKLEGDAVRAITVHVGARLAAIAEPLTSPCNQHHEDLVAGSGLVFEDCGEHELRYVPHRWWLYQVVSEPA